MRLHALNAERRKLKKTVSSNVLTGKQGQRNKLRGPEQIYAFVGMTAG